MVLLKNKGQFLVNEEFQTDALTTWNGLGTDQQLAPRPRPLSSSTTPTDQNKDPTYSNRPKVESNGKGSFSFEHETSMHQSTQQITRQHKQEPSQPLSKEKLSIINRTHKTNRTTTNGKGSFSFENQRSIITTHLKLQHPHHKDRHFERFTRTNQPQTAINRAKAIQTQA